MNAKSVTWEKPGVSIKVPNNEIHIWRTSLEQPDVIVSELSKVLTEDERAKAKKYYYKVDKARFIVGRSMLKKILSTYLSCNPEDISVMKNAYGKPYVLQERNNLEFSVTHSRDLALYSFVKGKKNGIDVEYKTLMLHFNNNIFFNFLSAREKRRYRNTPEKHQTEYLLKNWTLKEAYVKAVGVGHHVSFDKLDISFLEVNDSTEQGEINRKSKWCSYHFTPAFHYIAALVFEETYDRVQFARSVYFHLDP
jgi:4'-phosphopantetheinyl transferase